MAKSDRILYNLTSSIGYYLQNTELEVSGSNKLLSELYSGLSIMASYPDLEEMEAPCLAVDFVSNNPLTEGEYGDREKASYTYTIYGFAGSENTDAENKSQRDKLISDVESLLEDAVIPIYEWTDGVKGSKIGEATVVALSSSKLPEGITKKERYRFLTNIEVNLFTKLD